MCICVRTINITDMKKLFTLFIALVTSVGTTYASDISVDGIWYNFNSNTLTAEVTYSGPLPFTVDNEYFGTVTIPSTVTYNGKIYSITSIADFAFQNCSGLTSITIPNNVTSIGDNAFFGCTGLTAIEIPNSITSIGNGTFSGCINLTSVTIPNGITSIGIGAFSDCTGLTSITIPNSVTSIDVYAFYNCTGLTAPVYNAHVFAFMPTTYSGAYSIPDGIESIAGYAFYNCTGLTSIEIPNSVTSIGDGAFCNCTGLTSVTIPNSVTSIGNNAFSGCSSLTSVTINSNSVLSKNYSSNSSIKDIFGAQVTNYIIGDDVSIIGNYAFSGCTSLTSVTIPNSVTSIGYRVFEGCASLPIIDNIRYADTYLIEIIDKTLSTYMIKQNTKWIEEEAFYGCSSLTSIEIPNSVRSIGNYAFKGCSGLTSVTIPNSVTSIGYQAFLGCTSLTSVTIPNSVTSIGSQAFRECTSLTSVIIPNSVTSIGNGTFFGCTSLTSVTIPNSVISIGNQAFWECTSLTSVTIPNSVTNIYVGAFAFCDNLIYLIMEGDVPPSISSEILSGNTTIICVPCGTADIYKNNWSIYASQIAYYPSTDILTIESTHGIIEKTSTICEGNFIYRAIPDSGYHFVHWSDGNTENPRIIEHTPDSTLGVLIVSNSSYKLNVSCDSTYGAIDGEIGYFESGTEHIYTAIPKYGYHFTQWSDGNTENPRTIVVERNVTVEALFTINTYNIDCITDTQQGTVQKPDEMEYLQEVEMTAVPNYGYRFTQWSDGNTDNPRSFVITQDTTFEALFGLVKSGTCGNNNLLTWQYDDKSKTLTINGRGALTENYTYGVEAPTQMNNLIIGNDVTAIGERAFYKTNNIYHLVIGANVASIGDYAFAECKNFDDITCYADEVPDISAKTFANVGNKQYIYLFVPQTSQRRYLRDTYWSEFDIQVLNAESVTTTSDVKVTPEDNTATITWPSVEGAETYEIEITKDGVVVCTLIFNSNGQLSGIAFSPNRNNTQQTQTTGFKFTVTGLSSNTQYNYSVTSKDSNNTTIDTQSGSFETTGEVATELDNIDTSIHVHKLLHNGQILILRGGHTYTLTGQEKKY